MTEKNAVPPNTITRDSIVDSLLITRIRWFLHVLFGRRIVIFGTITILVLIILAIFGPSIAPYDPYEIDLSQALKNPTVTNLLGTDSLGRDILSRIVYGARISLLVGCVSVLLAAVIGMSLGLLSGYSGGIIDAIIMRFVDAMMSIPPLMLALVIGAALGGGLNNIIISLGISLTPIYARLMRSQVLKVMQNDYIMAGEAFGYSSRRIMLLHILPNCFSPLIVQITLNIGVAILAESSLSFLGLGIAPPGAAWGAMVSNGYAYLLTNPIMSFAPGICIALAVIAFNLVGDGLRDALDPRLRGII